MGIVKWDSLLRDSIENPIRRKIFLEGGSDAHGDFNYSTHFSQSIPILNFALDDNAFAKVRTYIYSEDAITETQVLASLRDGHSIVTDGPLVIFGIDKDADGSLLLSAGDIIPGGDVCAQLGNSLSFLIQWDTNSAYPETTDGSIDEIHVICGSSSGKTTETLPVSGEELVWTVPQPTEPGTYYYRVEAYIKDESGQVVYRAYTNPIWITWENNPPVLSNGRVSPAWGLYYDEFYFYVDYFDPDGHAPTVKQVFVDGEAHNMALSSGTASNGTYRYYGGWMSLGPHEHYFHFEDGFGGSISTPTSPTPSVYVLLHFQTSPYDLDITFDGEIRTTPYNAYVFPGTIHTIGTYSPQHVGQTSRYVWNRWSDELGETHEIVAPNGTANYVCYFTSQRLLTTSVNPVTGGTVSPAGSTWHNYYSTVPVTATPAPGYQFSRWSGTQTGTSNPIDIYINNAYSEVANFIVVSEGVSAPSVPAGDQSLAANEITSFTTGGSSCSYGHQVQYLFDWGDGTDSGWLTIGQTGISHSWPAAGAYPVRSKARCAETPAIESAWSPELPVTVSGSPHLRVDFNSDGQEDILWRYYGGGGYVRAWFLANSASADKELSADPVQMSNLEISREGGPSVARNALVSGPMRINAVAQKKKSLAPKISTLMGRRSGRQVRTARADDPRKAGGKAPMTAVKVLSDPRQAGQSPAKGMPLASSVPLSAAPMIQGGADVMSVGDMNWHIVGTGHFNEDFHIDVLWRNVSSGENVVWFMNGAEWMGSAELIPVSDLSWMIVGTGDFNNDMHADILWRNSSSGENVVWYMDGVSWLASAVLLGVSDVNWQSLGPETSIMIRIPTSSGATTAREDITSYGIWTDPIGSGARNSYRSMTRLGRSPAPEIMTPMAIWTSSGDTTAPVATTISGI